MIRAAYKNAVGAMGLAPSEFWSMSVREYLWAMEYHVEVAAQQQRDAGEVPEVDWADARRRHREKHGGGQ